MSSDHPLNPSGKRVLDFYKKYIKKNGKSPTLQEASEALKVSRPTVHNHLLRLELAGFVKRMPNRHRKIKIVNRSPSAA